MRRGKDSERLCKEHIKQQFGEEGEAVVLEHEQLIKDTIDGTGDYDHARAAICDGARLCATDAGERGQERRVCVDTCSLALVFVFFDKASRKRYPQHQRSCVSCCRTTALLSSGANRHDNKDGLGYDSLQVRLTIPVRRSFFYDDLNCTLLSAAMAGPGKTGLKATLKMGTLPTPHTQNNDSNRPHVFSLHRHATR